jgi:hypothetical protein
MKVVSRPSPRPTRLCSRVLSPACLMRCSRCSLGQSGCWLLVVFALNKSLAEGMKHE